MTLHDYSWLVMSLTPQGAMTSPTYSVVDNGRHLWWSLLTCWWHHGWIMASLRSHSIKYAPIRMLPDHYCRASMPLSCLFPIIGQFVICRKGCCELCVCQNARGAVHTQWLPARRKGCSSWIKQFTVITGSVVTKMLRDDVIQLNIDVNFAAQN